MSANITRVDGRTLSDTELAEAAREAVLRYSTLRIWGHTLQISATDGVVTLAGHVRTRASSDTAERVIRQVKGVKDVINKLYIDTNLEVAVAEALTNDARTVNSFPGILVGSAFGEIFLKGTVASPEIKTAAEQIAAKVDGVRAVTNQLVAPEPPKPAAPAKPAAAKPAPKPAPKPAEEEVEATEE